ncbi:MAG: helix-turn-helix transcriptional regulator [Sporolactobacillus sp.]
MRRRIDYRDVSRAKSKKEWEIYVKDKHQVQEKTRLSNSPVISSFCQQLIRLRKNQQCTQGDIAKRLPVNPSVISKVETGHYTISLQLLAALADALAIEIKIAPHSVTLLPLRESQ